MDRKDIFTPRSEENVSSYIVIPEEDLDLNIGGYNSVLICNESDNQGYMGYGLYQEDRESFISADRPTLGTSLIYEESADDVLDRIESEEKRRAFFLYCL